MGASLQWAKQTASAKMAMDMWTRDLLGASVRSRESFGQPSGASKTPWKPAGRLKPFQIAFISDY